jgi:hypothetical protein
MALTTLNTRSIPLTAILCIAGTIATASSSAVAQGNWRYWDVPDFDQRRPQLPGDGGMYCVPTSSMNIWAWYANHGYPQTTMLDGPRNWKSQDEHGRITDALAVLGAMMGTHPTKGTKGGSVSGAQLWNAAVANGDICVYGNHLFGDGALPSVDVFNGCYLLGIHAEAVYGRYENVNGGKRLGGHALTVIGMMNGGAPLDPVIQFRDPDDDGVNSVQSDFRTRLSTLNPTTGVFFNGDGTVFKLATLPRMDVTGAANEFLDQFLLYYPASALLTPPGIDANEFRVIRPKRPDEHPLPETQVFSKAPGTGPITGLAIAPSQLHYYYTCGTGSEKPAIWRINAVTGVSSKVAATTGLVPEALVASRFNDLYTIETVNVVRYQLGDGDSLPATKEGSLTLSQKPDAIAYDDSTDRVIIFSPSPGLGLPRAVRAFGRTLPAFGQVWDLGISLSGKGLIAPDPTDSEAFWVGAEGTSSVYRVKKSATTGDLEVTDTIANPGATIGGLNFTDAGTLVYTANEVLVEKMKDPGTGKWVNKPQSRWAGRLSSSKINISTSRSNFDKDVIEGPGFDNLVDPAYFPSFKDDCYADCDEDGQLNINDFICFQTKYAINDLTADCDLNGVRNIDDFICFQTLYALGC